MLVVPVLLSVALLILTVLVRWWSKDEDLKKALEFPTPPPMVAPVVETEVEAFGFEEYKARTVVIAHYQCAVCFCETNNRCARCKAVRYCSSKCQIAHWRQGHKYECHPQTPSVFEMHDSSGNVETMEQSVTNDNSSAERVSMMNDKGANYQMHSNISDAHSVMPRLSTVSMDSLDNTGAPKSGEKEGSVVDFGTPNLVPKAHESSTLDKNTSMKSKSPGLEKSVRNKYKEKLRQGDRMKTRFSHSDLSPGFVKDHSSEGFVAGDRHQSLSKEVPEVVIARQKHLQAFKHGEEKLLSTKQSVTSLSPAKGGTSSSPLPSSGFKSSLQKVVRHLKTSHQKKLALRNSLHEISGKHSAKAVFQYDSFTKLYSSNDAELKPFGLINCGNSCYANAVLQCLAYTRPLTLYLLEGRHSKECWKEEWCFICEFEHLILKAREGYTPLSPVQILSNISHLGHGREEDAHEFLRYAVDTMLSICALQPGSAGPVAEETTLIGMTFVGYLHSKIKCMKCRNKSEKYERMMDLTVEIDGDIRTLEQALKRFTASEVLEGDNKYRCSRCKSYEKAKKKLTVFQAPNILTIVLKRFQAGNFSKLNKPVQFPEILNMTPYMSGLDDRFALYSLYAVVVHLNATNAAISGHYVCYVKNYNGNWFKIDDSVVLNVDVETVLSEQAYMLLYARHSPRHPVLTRNLHDQEGSDPRHTYGKPAIPKPRHYTPNFSADPLVAQHQPSRNGHVKNPSYLEEWVTHSVESIPMIDSSSEVSSLFSHSEEGTCSTPSTKDSASVDDYSDYIFGRRGGTHG